MEFNPITEVYRAMENLSYEDDKFEDWESRIQIFHVTKSGGVAFVEDPANNEVWWLNAYSPNEKPDNLTMEFLFQLAAASGCRLIRSRVIRPGTVRLLKNVGFRKVGNNLYERSAC